MMLRSTEAIMAGLFVIFTLNYLFKIPEIEIEDPIKLYVDSLLDAYEEIEKEMVFRDPYSLILLLESSIPYGYGSRITVNLYKRTNFLSGINYTLPFETYEVLPGEVKVNLENGEVFGNWYQAVFVIKNNGDEVVRNMIKSISVALYKPDLNGDGIPEPIDPESILVFTESGKASFTLEKLEDYPDRTIVSLKLRIDEIQPGERKKIYVMYMVGDDYE